MMSYDIMKRCKMIDYEKEKKILNNKTRNENGVKKV